MLNLVFSPFGFFDVPLSISYLKSSLAQHGIKSRCYDFNIALFKKFNLLSESVHNKKHSVQNKYLDRVNWINRESFYERLMIEVELRESLQEFSDDILRGCPKIIGFSVFSTNLWFSLELIKLIRKKSENVKIIFGGPDGTISHRTNGFWFYEKAILDKLVDYVVIGEGEITLVELVRKIYSNQDITNVKGVYYRKEERVYFNGEREEIKDINTIPLPDYSDYDLSNYVNSEFPVVFSRGCNYECVFCGVKHVWQDKRIRQRTANDLIREIKKLEPQILPNRDNMKLLSFKGAYINPSKAILNELCDLLISEHGDNQRMLWMGYARVSKNITSELSKKMKRAGCFNLLFGLESGSPKVCRDMKKMYNHEIAAEVFSNTHQAGILCTVFIIIGFPTETEEDFQMTLDFLSENAENIDHAYCVTEFYLSDEMIKDSLRWGIKESPDGYEWKTIDGMNTLEIRRERLKRFYEHIEKLNIGN